jgi:hypothetical protein
MLVIWQWVESTTKGGEMLIPFMFYWKSQIAHIRVCHVRKIKFPIFPTNHKVQGNNLVYKLHGHAEDGIRQATTTIDLYIFFKESLIFVLIYQFFRVFVQFNCMNYNAKHWLVF